MVASVPAIPGIKADEPLASRMRQELANLIGRDSTRFPGAQPVSFAAKHLVELQKEDYYVCEKSDGIRCLMYLTNDRDQEITYLIDRKNDYYWIEHSHFPLPESEQAFHTDTLVDGELVNDREPNGDMQLKYLVFDCMMLDGNSLMHRTLDKRLAYFRDKVYNPYKALYNKYPQEKELLRFQVEFKDFKFSYGIEAMFKDVLPHLPHGNDGLIFTCRSTPYKFGTDEHILKWKDANENSIDFILTLDWPMIDPDSEDEREGISTPYPDYYAMPTFNLGISMGNGQYSRYGTMFVEPKEWEYLKSLNEPLVDRVVECHQDDQRRWRFLRFRDDKTDANHISTVESVMESIQDRITESELIGHAKRIRDAWKKRQAAEEARMKQEAAARKGLATLPMTNGRNGSLAEPGFGTKRKLEEGGNLLDGNENGRRKLTPQPEL